MIGTGLSALTFGMAGSNPNTNFTPNLSEPPPPITTISSSPIPSAAFPSYSSPSPSSSSSLEPPGQPSLTFKKLSMGTFEDMTPSTYLPSKAVFPVRTSLDPIFLLKEDNDFLVTVSEWGLVGY